VSLVELSKGKRRVLHMGWGNPKPKSRPGGEQMESSPTKKDLGLLGDEKLDVSHQCALAAQKANRAPGCIPSSVGSREGGVLPLCPTLMRPPQEFWSPQHRTDLELLERGQRRPRQ